MRCGNVSTSVASLQPTSHGCGGFLASDLILQLFMRCRNVLTSLKLSLDVRYTPLKPGIAFDETDIVLATLTEMICLEVPL